jgi:LPPG:FO 2-phospho-L-lactate transferase
VRHPRVIAISPIVAGAALKGPADVMLRAAGIEVSAAGVAGIYSDIVDTFVVDRGDAGLVERIGEVVPDTRAEDTIMVDHQRSRRLAEAILR